MVCHCGILLPREMDDLLKKCAATALSSKVIARQKDFFSQMVVDAVRHLDELLPLNMIGIKKVKGGSLEVSLEFSEDSVYLWVELIDEGREVVWRCITNTMPGTQHYRCMGFCSASV